MDFNARLEDIIDRRKRVVKVTRTIASELATLMTVAKVRKHTPEEAARARTLIAQLKIIRAVVAGLSKEVQAVEDAIKKNNPFVGVVVPDIMPWRLS